MSYVLYEKTDHIVTINLNRPDRMNAMGEDLISQLIEADKKFAADDDAWIAIYTGAGARAFSAGRDLKEASEMEAAGKKSSVNVRNVDGAMWLLLGGESIDAQEGHGIGLVTRVVPQAELLSTARQMAEIICQNSPLGVRATRTLAGLGMEMPMDYASKMGLELTAAIWESEDAVEGARAFMEKRKPNWKMK